MMRRFFVMLVLCLVAGTGAGHAGVLDDAERAILDGQPDRAIALLDAHAPETETETLRRLWILGVAHNRAGRPRDAVGPLARLVALVPDNAGFRLELAGALIRSNQSERARHHLEQATGARLPPDVRARVEGELDRLEKPETVQGYVRFAIVPETNAARRTAAEEIALGGLVFGLREASRAEPATGVELGFGLAAMPGLSDSLRFRLSTDIGARLFPAATPDDVTARGGAALVHSGQRGRQTLGEIFVSQRWLDQDAYTTTTGARLSHSRRVAPRTRMAGQILHEGIGYDLGFDVDRTAADLLVTHALSAQTMLRLGLRSEMRTSANTAAAGHAHGVTFGGDHMFAGGLRVGLDLSFDRNAHDGLHPLLGVQRIDRKTAVALKLTNQNWSHRGFAPVIEVTAERQHSTVVLNEYENVGLSIGLTRAF